jgi:hypothetical protein
VRSMKGRRASEREAAADREARRQTRTQEEAEAAAKRRDEAEERYRTATPATWAVRSISFTVRGATVEQLQADADYELAQMVDDPSDWVATLTVHQEFMSSGWIDLDPSSYLVGTVRAIRP